MSGAASVVVFVPFVVATLLLALEQRRYRRARARIAQLEAENQILRQQYTRLTGVCSATLDAGRYWRTAFMRLLMIVDPDRAQQGMRSIAQDETRTLLQSIQSTSQGGR